MFAVSPTSVCDVAFAAAVRICEKPLSGDKDRKIWTEPGLATFTSRQFSAIEVVDKDEVVTSIRGGEAAAIKRPNSEGVFISAKIARNTANSRTVAELATRFNLVFDLEIVSGDSETGIGTIGTSCLTIMFAGAHQVCWFWKSLKITVSSLPGPPSGGELDEPDNKAQAVT